MSDEVVAAVCYRQHRGDLQFLLVRTKGGQKWTFPKGHVKGEQGETPWEAAAREAREESGAIGKPLRTPFIHYLYPGKPSKAGLGHEYEVAAYLLEVESQVDPEEDFRQPTWFTLAEAREKLAEGGREPRYVIEHQRVLKAATERVGRQG
jgi:8-oxo-dGTP pyrophosphatase MutT (NUDIX family)